MLTNQKVFNKVYRHFVYNEGLPSMDDNNCVYRSTTPDGEQTNCAIGLFIADNTYHFSMEGMGVTRLFGNYPKVKTLFEGCGSSFLENLQKIHDRTALDDALESFSEIMKNKLIDFAKSNDLNIPRNYKSKK